MKQSQYINVVCGIVSPQKLPSDILNKETKEISFNVILLGMCWILQTPKFISDMWSQKNFTKKSL